MRNVRTALLATSALGFFTFGLAFVISFVRPLLVERIAREFVRREVEARVQKRIGALSQSWLVERAWRLAGRNDREIAAAKRNLSEGLPEKIAAVVAEMQEADCECCKIIAHAASTVLKVDCCGVRPPANVWGA